MPSAELTCICPCNVLLIQIRDLNDKCVKKFVAPRRKECPTPQIRFGHTEIKASGRMVSMWCEVR